MDLIDQLRNFGKLQLANLNGDPKAQSVVLSYVREQMLALVAKIDAAIGKEACDGDSSTDSES